MKNLQKLNLVELNNREVKEIQGGGSRATLLGMLVGIFYMGGDRPNYYHSVRPKY